MKSKWMIAMVVSLGFGAFGSAVLLAPRASAESTSASLYWFDVHMSAAESSFIAHGPVHVIVSNVGGYPIKVECSDGGESLSETLKPGHQADIKITKIGDLYLVGGNGDSEAKVGVVP